MHTLLVRLDPKLLEYALKSWGEYMPLQGKKHISINGKSLKSSANDEYPALHLLSAYCHNTQAVLAQDEVDTKENEFVCARKMLSQLSVAGSVVSGDALFCQRNLREKICKAEKDCLFIVKDNQPSLKEEIRSTFDGTLFPDRQIISDTEI